MPRRYGWLYRSRRFDMRLRIFKGDRYTRLIPKLERFFVGSRVPIGAVVRVVDFYPRRRAMIEYRGEQILTMTWCLKKL